MWAAALPGIFRADLACFLLVVLKVQRNLHVRLRGVRAEEEQAQASRGDVAKAASGNKNPEKMMAGMSLQSLLKQAGDAIKPDQIKALNAALQQVKKE